MANAQDRFNERYDDDKDTYEIILDHNQNGIFKGELIIENFTELQYVKVAGEPSCRGGLTKLIVRNCEELTRLDCSINSIDKLIVTDCSKLEELDVSSQYRMVSNDLEVKTLSEINIGEIGHKIKKINVSDNKLRNADLLDLLGSDNPDLIEIKCSSNSSLSHINVKGFRKLKKLYCGGNQLSKLDLTENSELEELYIENNGICEDDLTFLSHLTKMKVLSLGNIRSTNLSFFNNFGGSLEPLKRMRRLERLIIIGINIDDSDRHLLPRNLKIIKE
ncbi:hypothetical protein RhiirC2_868852 [Rhizophagus irregularis]|uniref:Uncharacterized protein n=1 Tax=Rhizophagus irregularis TaxID=588596 RepID=A0A2N1MUM3_9GLOM|nr:hypothetical protein RhiirC2_868852 [Rhizophagus irregularis]